VPRHDLAGAIMNRGNLLDNLGRWDEAVAAYDESIAIYRALVEKDHRLELRDALAVACYNLAEVREKQGAVSESDYETAMWLVLRHAARYGAGQVTLPACMLAAARRLPLQAYLIREQIRRYLYRAAPGSPLEQGLDGVDLALGDADCAFT
jgi:tetratricopeptide (TPR) repeat protein